MGSSFDNTKNDTVNTLYATYTSPIMHLFCPPSQFFHNLCFSFLLGITAVLGEIKNKTFLWANKLHYGRCASGV